MRRVFILPALAAIATATACGGSSASPSTASSAAIGGAGSSRPTGSAATGGVNPNAPETNPAGDIPDNTVYVPYHPPGAHYKIKVPEGWARTTKHGSTTFTDKLNSVTLQSHSARSAPTPASARTTTVPKIKAAAVNFKLVGVSAVKRQAGTPIEIHYTADSAPNSVTGKRVHDDVQRYEFYRSGTEVDVILSGPVGADNVDPWRIITNSFGWQ